MGSIDPATRIFIFGIGGQIGIVVIGFWLFVRHENKIKRKGGKKNDGRTELDSARNKRKEPE